MKLLKKLNKQIAINFLSYTNQKLLKQNLIAILDFAKEFFEQKSTLKKLFIYLITSQFINQALCFQLFIELFHQQLNLFLYYQNNLKDYFSYLLNINLKYVQTLCIKKFICSSNQKGLFLFLIEIQLQLKLTNTISVFKLQKTLSIFYFLLLINFFISSQNFKYFSLKNIKIYPIKYIIAGFQKKFGVICEYFKVNFYLIRKKIQAFKNSKQIGQKKQFIINYFF
ncbi:transmembrane protein, putative (macronuclear) [Tetrahymena thermophila SB210]|uniref:Transmembrane protein, putative n=1 Tax=Tetrahymena thermophila (strain SB210) TaxID=312017 RepID=W7XCN1_TETTS|nr:transmembrane protein, putative [Tetrahymena thermophila SB210]EWS75232.1 transmembrane protein, putative [Tetrahymena thermophila SB210]|eukprot:XP_012652223.1 transmembrane protein, putative [Tetrahymena thermophila SB210]